MLNGEEKFICFTCCDIDSFEKSKPICVGCFSQFLRIRPPYEYFGKQLWGLLHLETVEPFFFVVVLKIDNPSTRESL